jgi:hypothetical protein
MSALAKKLQIKPGSCWLLFNAPAGYPAVLEPLPDGAQLKFSPEGTFDGMQLFVKDSADIESALKLIHPLLKPDTYLWLVYPKKNSGIPTDLSMMSSWDEPAKYGLRPVASAAIDDRWTALRFRPETLVKVSESRNSAIKQNDYADYIDPDKKRVTLPPDAMEALSASPSALMYFDKLAYSHKKEYAVWVLSAKQDKTRIARVEKMVQMLLANKKNPSDK